jgi:hypothetical protein
MKRIVRLTENDLARIVRRVINEEGETAKGGSPAGYQDYLIQENFGNEISQPVYASLGSTVTPVMLPNKYGGPKTSKGNKLVVQAAIYNGKRGTETWKYQGKQTITFYQICGDAANFVAKDTINSTLSGGAGYFSKQEGPIQQKLVASCKAQGVTDILPSVNKML